MKLLCIAAIAADELCAQDGDLKKLQGAWNVVSIELNGQAVTPAGASFVLQGDHFTSRGMGAVYEGTISLDAAATPRSINFNFTAGPEKGNKSLGIYHLHLDTWRLCMAMRGDLP